MHPKEEASARKRLTTSPPPWWSRLSSRSSDSCTLTGRGQTCHSRTDVSPWDVLTPEPSLAQKCQLPDSNLAAHMFIGRFAGDPRVCVCVPVWCVQGFSYCSHEVAPYHLSTKLIHALTRHPQGNAISAVFMHGGLFPQINN